MEDRCIVCGSIIPEGRQVCPECEGMTEEKAIKWVVARLRSGRTHDEAWQAGDLAIKAMEAQIKLKEYIERINQPEYEGIVWKKDEVVLLLKELLAE